MAKNTLPSVDGLSEKPTSIPKPRAEYPTPEAAPIAEPYMPRRVDVKLPMRHRRILHDKLRALQDAGAKLQDGTEVSDRTKAVLWMLENQD